MYYRPEIDGLRAFAVLPVILFHAGFSAFGGGFVGVDVFFVISGYLITSILLRELEEGGFSLLQFYERRARRILPALFFVTAVTVPMAWVLMTPPLFQDFAQSVFAVALFASNFFFVWDKAGYFATDVELVPLLHTWSLAVEEQFYIVFPLLLAAIWGLGRRRIGLIFIVLALASLALAEWGWRNAPVMNFYLAPFRAWELLAGALCALYLSQNPIRTSNIGGLIGLALLLGGVFLYDHHTPFPSVYALMPVVGTVLIILCAGPQSWAGRILALKPIIWIGLLSYSAYLWHQPLFAFVRMIWITPPPEVVMLGLCLVSFGLAFFTWRFVEQPFRVSTSRPPVMASRTAIFATSLAGLAILAGFGLYGHARDGMPERFSAPDFVNRGEFTLARSTNGYCFYSLAEFGQLQVGQGGLNCMIGDFTSPDRRALLFGDSYAGQWEPFWHVVGEDTDMLVHSVTTNWCYPSTQDNFTGPNESRSHRQCRINRQFLQDNAQEYDLIILAGDWRSVTEQGLGDEPLALLDMLLETTDAHIVVMASPAALHPRSVERAVFLGRPDQLIPHPDYEDQIVALHTDFMRLDRSQDRVLFLDRDALFGSDAVLSSDGQPYSLDGGHISIYGALAAVQDFLSHDSAQELFADLIN